MWHASGGPAYKFGMRVLNSRDHALPQDRSRLYIVGLRADLGADIVWPKLCPPVALSTIYDARHTTQPIESCFALGETASRNIRKYIADIAEHGIPENKDFVIDIHEGRGASLHYDKMPTITRTRGASLAYALCKFGTQIRLQELMRAQGLRPERVCIDNLSQRDVGSLMGNAMSVNVVRDILRVNLHALGF